MTQGISPSVLFVCPRFHTNHRGWVRRLTDRGWTVSAVVAHIAEGEDHSDVSLTMCPTSRLSEVFESLGIFVGENFPNRGPGVFWALRYLRRAKPNLIVVRGRANLLSLVFLLSARLKHIPVVIYDQEPLYFHGREKARKKVFDSLLFDAGMTPVIGSPGHRRSTMWSFVPFESPTGEAIRLKRLPARRFVAVAKYSSNRKRLEMLLDAALQELSSEDELTVIGTSPDGKVPENLRRYLDGHERFRLEFKVNLTHQETLESLREFDVFVLPAANEPAAVSVVEALSAGLFVICSDTCGTRGEIPPGRGIVFRTGETDDLRSAIRRMRTGEQVPVDGRAFSQWETRRGEATSICDFVGQIGRIGPG